MAKIFRRNSPLNDFAQLYGHYEKITRLKMAWKIFKESSLTHKTLFLTLGAAVPAIYTAAMTGIVDLSAPVLSTQLSVGAAWLLATDSMLRSANQKSNINALKNPLFRKDHSYLRSCEFRKHLAFYTHSQLRNALRTAKEEVSSIPQASSTNTVTNHLITMLIALIVASATNWPTEAIINFGLVLTGAIAVNSAFLAIRMTNKQKMEEFCKFISREIEETSFTDAW